MQELLFEEAYKKYMSYISLNLKPTTVLGIKRKFQKHILPIFDKKNIYDLDMNIFIDWQYYIFNLSFSNSFNNQVYSMLNKFCDYLNKFYGIENYALRLTSIQDFNNCEEFKEKETWTLKEFRKFIKVVKDVVYHALFNFLFFTGVRKGEALALNFKDIKGKYVYISKTITKEYFNGKRIFLTPKSKKSRRKIRLDWKLRLEIKLLEKYYTKMYGYFDKSFFIFGGLKPLSTTTLDRKKNNYCKIAGVKQITIHGFRHSHATLLYHKKIKIKYIQMRLGHADVSTTINTYVHNDNKYEKKVYNTLNFLRLFI